eukprot:g2769.t1
MESTDRIVDNLISSEIKTRQSALISLQKMLKEGCIDFGLYWTPIMNGLLSTVSDNNFRVCLNTLDCAQLLLLADNEFFRPYISQWSAATIERMGDAKLAVRQKASETAIQIGKAYGLSTLIDQYSKALTHHKWKVREQGTNVFQGCKDIFRNHAKESKRIFQIIADILGDSQKPVREAALEAIVAFRENIGQDEQVLSLLESCGVAAPQIQQFRSKIGLKTMEKSPSRSRVGIKSGRTKMRPSSRGEGDNMAAKIYKMEPVLRNLDSDWTVRRETLNELETFARDSPELLRDSAVLDALQALRKALQVQIKDLRSSIVKDATAAVSAIANALEELFEPLATPIATTLLQLTFVKIAAIRVPALECMEEIIGCSQRGFKSLVVLLLDRAGDARNGTLRASAARYLGLAFRSWNRSTFEKMPKKLAKTIEALLTDRNADARFAARSSFLEFSRHFPLLAEDINSRLSSSTRRQLEVERESGKDALVRPRSRGKVKTSYSTTTATTRRPPSSRRRKAKKKLSPSSRRQDMDERDSRAKKNRTLHSKQKRPDLRCVTTEITPITLNSSNSSNDNAADSLRDDLEYASSSPRSESGDDVVQRRNFLEKPPLRCREFSSPLVESNNATNEMSSTSILSSLGGAVRVTRESQAILMKQKKKKPSPATNRMKSAPRGSKTAKDSFQNVTVTKEDVPTYLDSIASTSWSKREKAIVLLVRAVNARYIARGRTRQRVLDTLIVALTDGHYRVVQAGMVLLESIVATYTFDFAASMEAILPHVFSLMDSSKRETRELALKSLDKIRERIKPKDMLTALLAASISQKVNVRLECLAYISRSCKSGEESDEALVDLLRKGAVYHLKQLLARLSNSFLHRSSKLRQAAVKCALAVHEQSDGMRWISAMTMLSPSKQDNIVRALERHLPDLGVELAKSAKSTARVPPSSQQQRKVATESSLNGTKSVPEKATSTDVEDEVYHARGAPPSSGNEKRSPTVERMRKEESSRKQRTSTPTMSIKQIIAELNSAFLRGGTIRSNNGDDEADAAVAVSQQRALHRLLHYVRFGNFGEWTRYFPEILRTSIRGLGVRAIEVQERALYALHEMVLAYPQGFEDAIDHVICSLIDCADTSSSQSVTFCARNTLIVLCRQLKAELCFRALLKTVREASAAAGNLDSKEKLRTALRVVSDLLPRIESSALETEIFKLVPCLCKAINHASADIRKAVVFLVVDIYKRLGDSFLESLQVHSTTGAYFMPAQIQLVKLYIQRATRVSSLSATAQETGAVKGKSKPIRM